MQCQRCGFHNMPGLDRCGRCSSVLAGAAQVDVHPPRAGRMRWLRGVGYSFSRLRASRLLSGAGGWMVEGAARLRRWMPPLWAGVISVIPGAGHLLTGRFGRIKRWWLAWCGLILLGLFFYGTTFGGVLIGLAMATHAWIICDAVQLMELEESAGRRIFVSVLVFLLLLLCVYMPIRTTAGTFVRGVFVGNDMQAAGVLSGDYVLVWMHAYDDEPPRRGDLVLYGMGGFFERDIVVRGGETVSRVIGLPGESVSVQGGQIAVAGHDGVTRHFQFRSSIEGSMEFVVPARVFICLPPDYTMRTYGVRLSLDTFIRSLAMPSADAIQGRAFMVWNPLWRRGWIKREDVESAP